MRIALLIGSANAGGSENQMRLLARWLQAAGHEVTVIFTDHHHCRFQRNPASVLDFSGIDNIKLSMRRFYRLFYKPYGKLRIKLKNFDIAMACGAHNSYIMCELFKNSRTKMVCRLSDLIFADNSSISDKNKTATALTQVHAVVSNAQIALTEAENMQLVAPELYRKVIRNAVVCPDKINEVQVDRFHVIFVGRLQKIKDPMTLLKAMKLAKKEIPHLTGEFVGSGVLFEEMQNYITEQGLADFIKLSGFIQQQQIPYPTADLLVNSSQSELSSGAIAEALYRGIPVVASKVGGNPELLKNQPFGALFPAGNVKACAAEIIKFARKTPQERQQLASRARAFAEENFSIESFSKNYIAFFKRVLSGKHLE